MVAEEQKKFERINTIIHENSQEASYYVAQEIVSLVTQRQQEGKKNGAWTCYRLYPY